MKTKGEGKKTEMVECVKRAKFSVAFASLFMLAILAGNTALGHCDSYDGPVITDAKEALEANNPKLVFKWISREQESEIASLFKKTIALKSGDQEIYEVVENYFFETLVRLHRETEGAPYTGLKAPGTTKKIIQMSDNAVLKGDVDDLITRLNSHVANVIREKYDKVVALNQQKNESVKAGRDYVAAYVDYTHTLEAVHSIVEHGNDLHGAH
ncbi:DUF6448 family protein [Mariniphaga sediminis]|nr:DUF6448 family protein [Mariniphaga sediminis]